MRLQSLTLILHVVASFLVASSVAGKSNNQPWVRTTTDSHHTFTSRFLRAHKFTETTEERGITPSGVEALASTFKSTTYLDDELKALLDSGKTADDALKVLALDKAVDDLLSNPKLEQLTSYVKHFNEQNPTKQTTLIATLTAHFGDEGLAKIIEKAKQVQGTEATANRMQAEQLQGWLGEGKSADDVFKLLKLNEASENLLSNSLLETWTSYMKLFNKQYPKKRTSLISTLMANYGNKDLAEILGRATHVDETSALANRLETEQVYLWLEEKPTPNEIFKMLELNTARYTLFDKPQVNSWMKYTVAYNSKFPKAKATFLSSLEHFKYTDEELISMLIAAKNVPRTEAIAKRIQSEQTLQWLNAEKQPDDIFKLLKLNNLNEKENLLQNPLFGAWLKYTDDFNTKYPRLYDLPMSTMLGYFSSESVAKMILEASKNPSTKRIAKRLDTELVEQWFKNGRTPTSVFTQLKLNQRKADDLFDSPLLPTWLQFAYYFVEKNPDEKLSVITVLKNQFKDDAVLSKMLLDAFKKKGYERSCASAT
ncbi:unnamed protein product [Phytophthora fragariaefolia]|uniref:Unnamed protein product n=1 Tax=Phytophthora fragariaefolia TaxID=1490495 RepID=A0A9W6XSF1_9STRA|nr:unnamed protein product [Phytophthora fragariaefolia]